ncbi:unnamed protein product, partial [Tenebrio molitor]
VIVYVLRQNCRAAGWRWDRIIMEIILDRVFETVEKKKPSHSTVIYTQDTSHGGIENIKSDKKIQVLSIIIVREKTDIEVWEKHLHW